MEAESTTPPRHSYRDAVKVAEASPELHRPEHKVEPCRPEHAEGTRPPERKEETSRPRTVNQHGHGHHAPRAPRKVSSVLVVLGSLPFQPSRTSKRTAKPKCQEYRKRLPRLSREEIDAGW